jgi:hypothetical protein
MAMVPSVRPATLIAHFGPVAVSHECPFKAAPEVLRQAWRRSCPLKRDAG